MSPPAPHAATLSIRLLWSFARLLGGDPRGRDLIGRAGIGVADFGNPETRVPHRAVMQILEDAVAMTGDPTLGLRAGALVEQGDYDVLEYAARSTPDFGTALGVMARYSKLIHEGAEMQVSFDGDIVTWSHRIIDGVVQPPAANDFVLASALAFSRRNAAVYEPPLEVHLKHERPAYADEYARYFECKVVFGAPYNATVMRRARLRVPMARANPEFATAFELQAQRVLEKLSSTDLAGRVRTEVAAQLRTGTMSMEATARRLAMAEATLRRRLEEEGTTFSDIVDALRRELAESHLSGSNPTVSEVAFLLGFSDVRAFSRAFRRWTGITPTEYRTRRTG